MLTSTLIRFSFRQKNEMEKEFLKLQEAHEGQQALLQKLQVCSDKVNLTTISAISKVEKLTCRSESAP